MKLSAPDILHAGLRTSLARPDLVLLMYGMRTAVSLAVAANVARHLGAIVDHTGFGAELMAADLVLWADIIADHRSSLFRLPVHLLWLLPLSFVWNAVVEVGLPYALRPERRSFWRGAWWYGGRSLLVGVVYLIVAVIGIALLLVVSGTLAGEVGGETANFWLLAVVTPAAVVVVLIAADYLCSIARGSVVCHDAGAVASLLRRHQPGLMAAYAVWKVALGVVLTASIIVQVYLGAGVASLVVQQILFLGAVVCGCGWYGGLAAALERQSAARSQER